MDERSVLEWLVARVAACTGFDGEDIDPDAPFAQYGLTSRDALTLSGEIEDLLGCTVSPTVVWEHPTIRSMAAYVAAGAPAS